MSVEYINESEIKAAIGDLRNDKTPTDWVLLSFETPKSKKVKLLASGSGGVEALLNQLSDDLVGFGLVRKIDVIDNSETVKYAFIQWIGDKVGLLQKAFVSIATSSIKTLFTPYHVDFQISHKSELSDAIVHTKIQETSGSGSRVLDETGARRTAASSSTSVRTAGAAPAVSKDAIALADESSSRAALRSFRSDDSGINWILFGYEGSSIVLLGSGSGGPSELIANLNDDMVAYGLTRSVEKIDNSNTVKFAKITWIGEGINRMLRARLGTHSGFIKELLSPYHVDIQATTRSEISEEIIIDTITKNSGTQSRVLADAVSPRATAVPTRSTGGVYKGTSPSSVPTSSGAPVIAEEDVRAAIKDVRSDSTPTNWTLIGYKPNNTTLTVIASGNGDADELASHLQSNIVAYGLIRVRTQFDLSEITQFVWVNFVGEDIPRMFRAKLGTHSGIVKDVFSPYHVDIQANTPSEVNAEIVLTRVTSNAGTLSKVR
ncbi:hypothetical protein SAMD00019534_090580 [Acytostelium subglobosum LB1]|uniref:hypothetical protein n=1 Tax=Acytostelium subglobosum LB1 TaxID=1410327 RepID=UPI000644FF2F|nr:hypothetical protein SAMD00019534_090580 [Acytostelium subglobosum LB1]GAM25883.1 hypothetical protein SAMD00019534_090580 [Acytostelium subglobosum LB1]|eukprot:XP_012750926.1 hypothetical protein SAMD00019534_090580 [Acytostelium subglobosum LB1]